MLLVYWIIFFFLTSFTNLSKPVKFCSEFFVLFSHYFIAAITLCCHVHVSDTFVFLTITLIVICFFYNVKSWYLDFLCTFTLCQLTLSARLVGTCAEVRENAFPSSSLLIASNLCRSGCSPRLLLPLRAVTFNLTGTRKMWKIITWKVCRLSSLFSTDRVWWPYLHSFIFVTISVRSLTLK